MNQRISVIIATFNGMKFLREQLIAHLSFAGDILTTKSFTAGKFYTTTRI